ncbi:MAG: trans-aconitate methyltransferase [Cereibacter sphaeroides]|uniref:Trans-aconitate methyltransferase n=1 Tax=Cereibacter sphaeroides TaxID=1063 RepID=A0A2W5SBZ1_CERSP|nr:MAG: trans-aconitate methyltransferase [Cereibacter sphaeroides]
MTDWDPEAYSRFRGLRLRPALDLLAQVGVLPPGPVVDLGCGDGAVAPELKRRFPDMPLIGVDNSAAMLAKADELRLYSALHHTDIAVWSPQEPPALIFSNAALQWLPDHETLMPRLAGYLAPGGVLAVQMPGQDEAPSHRLLREVAIGMFPHTFAAPAFRIPVSAPDAYWRLLQGMGDVNAWETHYVQRMEPTTEGHPVRRFTESTAMRRIVEKLEPHQVSDFVRSYDEALHLAYPLLPDGAALMTFRRVFFVLHL